MGRRSGAAVGDRTGKRSIAMITRTDLDPWWEHWQKTQDRLRVVPGTVFRLVPLLTGLCTDWLIRSLIRRERLFSLYCWFILRRNGTLLRLPLEVLSGPHVQCQPVCGNWQDANAVSLNYTTVASFPYYLYCFLKTAVMLWHFGLK